MTHDEVNKMRNRRRIVAMAMSILLGDTIGYVFVIVLSTCQLA